MTTNEKRPTAREFWHFYRGYVDSPIHALSAALLAIFGILVFVDPLFALLAIASYVVPPIVLFSTGWSARFGRETEPETRLSEPNRSTDPRSTEGGATGNDRTERKALPRPIDADSESDATSGNGDSDSDGDDGDTDSDSDDGDTDSDTDDGDTDTDSDN